MSALDVARLWASRGVPAFAAAIGPDGTSTAKRPLTANGHHDATNDPDALRAMFTSPPLRLHGGEVLVAALHPGGGGYTVIDIDNKHGKNGYPAADNLGLRDTYGATTPSGGEHRWYRNPPGVEIGNRSPWEGIDIRADDGWVIAPGTTTPLGAWTELDGHDFTADVEPLPTEVLDRLDRRAAGTRSTAGWRRLTDDDRATLDPATLEAVDALLELGGHDPILRTANGREPWVEITRPGKRHGTSASVGRIGPGAVKAFTPNWPGLPEGVHDIADNGQLIDRAGARAARDARQLEEWAGDPADPGDTLTAGWSTLLWADLTSPDDRPDETPALVAAGDGHVFYQGRHNDLHAPPGAGKTWLLYSVFAHALDDGHSILAIDYEDTPRTFRQRLAALGVPADVISDPTRVRYVNVPARIGPDETDDIDQAVTALSTGGRHVVVGIDAMADALANDGADESSNVDVTRWHRRVIAHLLRSGCTVVTLDHIAKAADRPSNGARGAGAKLGLVDGVSYELKLLEGFSVGHAGKIALKIVKDRHGAIGPPRTHAFTAHINPDTDGHLAIRWEPASTTDRAPFRPTGYMERVSTWVAAQDAPPSQRQVDESVPGGSHYIRDALAHLVSEGYLKLTLGPRNAKNYEHVRPYSEATDPLTAAPRHDRGTTAAETRCDDRGTAAPPLIRGAGAAVALPPDPDDRGEPETLDIGAGQ